MLSDKRIKVIVGHYGSGKTEFSVNYVLKLAAEGKKSAIVDLDVVNPYFRSREKKELLESKGIRVISNSFDKDIIADLPSLSASIMTPLQDLTYDAVLDVGGNFIGAKALARYTKYFQDNDYDMFCVINANRPDTSTVEGALEHLESIESETGVKITGLINNTHMLRETTVEDVLRGQTLCKKLSEAKSIPIKYISCTENVAEKLPKDLEGEIFIIRMHMRPSWL